VTSPGRVYSVFLAIILISAAAVTHAEALTHIEQNDPSVTYSGGWWPNTNASHRGGEAVLTNTRGSRATVSFTGTGITWKGVADAWAGLATVYIDGRMQIVDTYAPTSRYQQAILSVRNLAAGPHTLTIEVTHERGPSTSGSWVWIDGFDIEGEGLPGGVTATAGHIEENSPALLYTGRWYANPATIHSGSGATLAMDAGSRATLTFTGTGISWRGFRDQWSGIATVYVDGEAKGTIDCYLGAAQPQATLFVVNGLSAGEHRLTIEVTGRKGAGSQGTWVWIDAFDVIN
jgi:hypothetical protein